MPAVHPDDLSDLPRIAPITTADTAERSPVTIVDAPRMLEGAGFEVRRAFAGIDHQLVDPFLLLDHMGAVEYAPGEAKGAPDHPHRGFETVAYMLDGELEHRDSNGGGGLITDGATQWMTAGSGIVHSEMPTERIVTKGGLFHGVQLWVNLPSAQKWAAPQYQDIDSDKAPPSCWPRRTEGPWSASSRATSPATADRAAPEHRSPTRTQASTPESACSFRGAQTSMRLSTCSRAVARSARSRQLSGRVSSLYWARATWSPYAVTPSRTARRRRWS